MENTTSILNVPVWEDCPLREVVPDVYEIRKGPYPEWDGEVLILVYKPPLLSVVVSFESGWLTEQLSKCLKVMVHNLGLEVFRVLHPAITSHKLRTTHSEYLRLTQLKEVG